MRKPPDFDAALRALTDKTKALKENKRQQLGELIVATGADTLDMETLAGGLLAIVEASDNAQKEGWRKRGAAFFRKTGQPTSRKPGRNASSAPAGGSSETPAGSPTRET
jgi:hypothetical protein